MILALFVALFVSIITGGLMVRYAYLHENFSVDHLEGPQKVHQHKAIRLGGIVILVGWICGVTVTKFKFHEHGIYYLGVASLPIFFAGLIEDITRKVSPRVRLISALITALSAFYLMGAGISRVDIPLIDSFLTSYSLFSLLLTMFSIGGVIHAFNIIDGHNGLSGMVAIIILAGISYVAFKLNDTFILGASFATIGAIAGFLFWNYPHGNIFAGDGGAYFMGYIVSVLSVILVKRHPEVSAWLPVLLLIYPIFETLFSMYRRKMIQGRSVTYPDSLHLHSIIYRRIVRLTSGLKKCSDTKLNAQTSVYLWFVTLTSVLPAMVSWNQPFFILFFIFTFIFGYVWIYRMIVNFKTPFFLNRSKLIAKPNK